MSGTKRKKEPLEAEEEEQEERREEDEKEEGDSGEEDAEDDAEEEEEEEEGDAKVAKKKEGWKSESKVELGGHVGGAKAEKEKGKRKKAKVVVQEWTERQPAVPRSLPDFPSPQYFKVVSWNVNGLKPLINDYPTLLKDLMARERVDLLCLQETKLQAANLEKVVPSDVIPGYTCKFNCSTVKKGYSGTAVFYRKACAPANCPSEIHKDGVVSKKAKKQTSMMAHFQANAKANNAAATAAAVSNQTTTQPTTEGGEETAGGLSPLKVLKVTFGLKDHLADGHGRAITVEYEPFFVVNVYVPNAGEKLQTLDYRLNEWNTALRDYVTALEEQKPVIVCGDLNVAHLDIDIYNVGKPSVKRQPSCTPQERSAFADWLTNGGVKDVFRHFHPETRGQFTQWSQRKTEARPLNRGLRIDYFVISDCLCPHDIDDSSGGGGGSSPSGVVAVDCYHDYHPSTAKASDHCPVVLTLRAPPSTATAYSAGGSAGGGGGGPKSL